LFSQVLTNLQDQDGALKTEELEDLFSTSPGNPWASQGFPDTTVSDDTGAVTLQGWLAQWMFVEFPRDHLQQLILGQFDNAS